MLNQLQHSLSAAYEKINIKLHPEIQALTDEGQTYFGQVLAEFQLTVVSAAPTQEELHLRQLAGTITEKKSEDRTWSDLFELETCVLKLLSEPEVRNRAWSLRAKYKDIAGEKYYAAYEASKPPDPATGDIDSLRADLEQILSQFHWIYAFTPVREHIRNQLAINVFSITVILLVSLIVFIVYAYQFDGGTQLNKSTSPVPILPVIMALGMIGGFVSLQRRIQSVQSTGDPIAGISELSNSSFSMYLAPISGAVFAVLLYLFFISQLLKGPIFPVIITPEGPCDLSTLDNGKPAKNGENTDATFENPVAPPLITAGSTPGSAPKANDKSPETILRAGGKSVGTDSTTTDKSVGTSANTDGKSKDSPPNAGESKGQARCSKSVTFEQFVKYSGPGSGVQFALLLLWAFIAGFAERFVPDTIDRIVSQSAAKK